MNVVVEKYSENIFFFQSDGQRTEQQDDFFCCTENDCSLIILCDGMGGHQAGRKASELIIESFLQTLEDISSLEFFSKERMSSSLERANQDLSKYVKNHPSAEGLGATVICALLCPTRLDWLSVGDSHLYLVKGSTIKKINKDHSMKPLLLELIKNKKLTPEDAQNHPMRNTLRSAVTGGEISLVDINDHNLASQDWDYCLMATDGLDSLDDRELEDFFGKNSHSEVQEIGVNLLNSVLDKAIPDQDNVTFGLFRLGS